MLVALLSDVSLILFASFFEEESFNNSFDDEINWFLRKNPLVINEQTPFMVEG